jgi:hypothetical protein
MATGTEIRLALYAVREYAKQGKPLKVVEKWVQKETDPEIKEAVLKETRQLTQSNSR